MEKVEIGQLLNGSEKKDAIHIAIYPAVADKTLHPGTPVTLRDDDPSIAVQCPAGVSIGIVDPYLRAPLRPGDRFYIFINPGTITGLRHDWTHPMLKPEFEVDRRLEEAKQWMRDFADDVGMSYKEIINAGDMWVKANERTTQYSSSAAQDTLNNDKEKTQKFWECYKIITGREPKDTEVQPFSCSC